MHVASFSSPRLFFVCLQSIIRVTICIFRQVFYFLKWPVQSRTIADGYKRENIALLYGSTEKKKLFVFLNRRKRTTIKIIVTPLLTIHLLTRIEKFLFNFNYDDNEWEAGNIWWKILSFTFIYEKHRISSQTGTDGEIQKKYFCSPRPKMKICSRPINRYFSGGILGWKRATG